MYDALRLGLGTLSHLREQRSSTHDPDHSGGFAQMKNPDQIYGRYQELQTFVNWTDEDARQVHDLAPILDPHLPALVDDFYAEIARHPEAHKVFTGGQKQVYRLKFALQAWLHHLLTGAYDREYVLRRWTVGARHVEIGLDQVYTNMALSRLRDGLTRLLDESWPGDRAGLVKAIRSLNKLLDIDLAKIGDAYQAEYAARLQGAERLATLGQIAGGVAHELRNPLNVVKTSLYYLNSARAVTPEKQTEHMRRIERNVTRADEVITTLTNFARVPVPEVKPFSIESCVRDVLAESIIPTVIEVSIDFPADLPPALADRGQIGIVLGNLVRNAVDAMPSSGQLILSGRRVEDGLEVEVADTGSGIAPFDLGRIMEPLFSTKARGMGLGLALSKMILDRNRGSLRVASELGKGSQFTVRMAVAPLEGDLPG